MQGGTELNFTFYYGMELVFPVLVHLVFLCTLIWVFRFSVSKRKTLEQNRGESTTGVMQTGSRSSKEVGLDSANSGREGSVRYGEDSTGNNENIHKQFSKGIVM